MIEDDGAGQEAAAATARQTISAQRAEIQHLQSRLEDEHFARDLRDVLSSAMVVGAMSAPVTHDRLLEMVVETAVHTVGALEGSLFSLDTQSQELLFEVAVGEHAPATTGTRSPHDSGVANLVAATGQAMIVSEVDDERGPTIAGAGPDGPPPKSLLCVPLVYDDRIVGVLELFDKARGGSFDQGDSHLLSPFSNLAGVAIEHSRRQLSLTGLLEQIVLSLDGLDETSRGGMLQRATQFALHTEADDEQYTEALELARLVHTIALHGGAAHRAVRTMLGGFAEYLETSPKGSHG